ncbi:unnamed protein product [[Candida] boidinii]|uniref:Unnamed protein product n=1 Tax=Candida boidinii TaxID=5477 RepID=A0A9W6ST80_CANBO|nr:hypothetical protein B5S30_g1185 [[Candida] boidinii]GME66805.1 unnamed protein product [[Candida] boidinii]
MGSHSKHYNSYYNSHGGYNNNSGGYNNNNSNNPNSGNNNNNNNNNNSNNNNINNNNPNSADNHTKNSGSQAPHGSGKSSSNDYYHGGYNNHHYNSNHYHHRQHHPEEMGRSNSNSNINSNSKYSNSNKQMYNTGSYGYSSLSNSHSSHHPPNANSSSHLPNLSSGGANLNRENPYSKRNRKHRDMPTIYDSLGKPINNVNNHNSNNNNTDNNSSSHATNQSSSGLVKNIQPNYSYPPSISRSNSNISKSKNESTVRGSDIATKKSSPSSVTSASDSVMPVAESSSSRLPIATANTNAVQKQESGHQLSKKIESEQKIFNADKQETGKIPKDISPSKFSDSSKEIPSEKSKSKDIPNTLSQSKESATAKNDHKPLKTYSASVPSVTKNSEKVHVEPLSKSNSEEKNSSKSSSKESDKSPVIESGRPSVSDPKKSSSAEARAISISTTSNSSSSIPIKKEKSNVSSLNSKSGSLPSLNSKSTSSIASLNSKSSSLPSLNSRPSLHSKSSLNIKASLNSKPSAIPSLNSKPLLSTSSSSHDIKEKRRKSITIVSTPSSSLSPSTSSSSSASATSSTVAMLTANKALSAVSKASGSLSQTKKVEDISKEKDRDEVAKIKNESESDIKTKSEAEKNYEPEKDSGIKKDHEGEKASFSSESGTNREITTLRKSHNEENKKVSSESELSTPSSASLKSPSDKLKIPKRSTTNPEFYTENHVSSSHRRKRPPSFGSSDSEINTDVEESIPLPSRKTRKLIKAMNKTKNDGSDDERKLSSSNNHSLKSRSVSRSESPIGKKEQNHQTRKFSSKAGKDASGRSLLQRVCAKGNYKEAQSLIKMGANVNESDYAGNTPLHEAALEGFSSIVNLLLDHGADINKQSGYMDLDTALIDAASNLHLDVVSILLERGADPTLVNVQGDTALDALDRDRDINDLEDEDLEDYKKLKKLLAKETRKFRENNNNSGASNSISGSNNSSSANRSSSRENSQNNNSNSNKSSSNYNSDGDNVSKKNSSSANKHSQKHNDAKDDIIAPIFDLGFVSKKGQTELFKRVADNDVTYVANYVSTMKPPSSLLCVAAKHGHTEIASLLLAFGADIDYVDRNTGKSPLMFSVGKNHYETVKLLLNNDPNPFQKDKQGRTAVDLAKESDLEDDREVEALEKYISNWRVKQEDSRGSEKTGTSGTSTSRNENKKEKKRKIRAVVHDSDSEEDDGEEDLNDQDDNNEESFEDKSEINKEKTSDKPVDKKPKVQLDDLSGHHDKNNSSSSSNMEKHRSTKKQKKAVSESSDHIENPENAVKIERQESLEKSKNHEDPETRKPKVEVGTETVTESENLKTSNSFHDLSSVPVVKSLSGSPPVTSSSDTKSASPTHQLDSSKKLTFLKDLKPMNSLSSLKSKVELSDSNENKIDSQKENPSLNVKDRERTPIEEDLELKKAREAEAQKKKAALELQRLQRKKARQQQIANSIAAMEKKREEERREAELREEEKRLKQQQEDERKRQKAIEDAKLEAQRREVLLKLRIRSFYPIGLRQAVFGSVPPIETLRNYLPLYVYSIDGVKYCSDIQLAILLGIENLHNTFPQWERKSMSSIEKSRLWNFLWPMIGSPTAHKGALNSTVVTKEYYETEERNFKQIVLHWIKLDDLVTLLDNDVRFENLKSLLGENSIVEIMNVPTPSSGSSLSSLSTSGSSGSSGSIPEITDTDYKLILSNPSFKSPLRNFSKRIW